MVKFLKLVCKSGWPDYVLNDFFKYGIEYMITYLHKLFNHGYFLRKDISQLNGLTVSLCRYTQKGGR